MMEPSPPCATWKSLQCQFVQCRAGNSPEGLEGVCAGHVRVEHEERRVVLAEDIAGEGERTGWDGSAFD